MPDTWMGTIKRSTASVVMSSAWKMPESMSRLSSVYCRRWNRYMPLIVSDMLSTKSISIYYPPCLLLFFEFQILTQFRSHTIVGLVIREEVPEAVLTAVVDSFKSQAFDILRRILVVGAECIHFPERDVCPYVVAQYIQYRIEVGNGLEAHHFAGNRLDHLLLSHLSAGVAACTCGFPAS